MSLATSLNNVIKTKMGKVCDSLGRNNDALYAVLAIALFKGIMRPTFTMMDKESDPKAKKYAAFREGITEAIAFGSYIATHSMVKPLAHQISKAANMLHKEDKVAKGLSLVSVCLSAAVIIPAVCNLTLKPIMKTVEKVLDNKKAIKIEKEIDEKAEEPVLAMLDIKETEVDEKPPVTQVIAGPGIPSAKQTSLLQVLQKTAMSHNGMKVGG